MDHLKTTVEISIKFIISNYSLANFLKCVKELKYFTRKKWYLIKSCQSVTTLFNPVIT